MHFSFPVGGITKMELGMLLRRLRVGCHARGTLVAQGDMLADNTSLMMEFNDPKALDKYLCLCNEAAFIDNRSALIRTEASPDVWVQDLTAGYAADQEIVVSGIRWRQSRLGGKLWARPPPHPSKRGRREGKGIGAG